MHPPERYPDPPSAPTGPEEFTSATFTTPIPPAAPVPAISAKAAETRLSGGRFVFC